MYTRALKIHNLEKKIIISLMFLLVFQALGYVYLINSSIFNVVARKEQEEMIAVTETEITALVSNYLALSENINLDLAYSLGFKDAPKETLFAVIPQSAVAFSSLDNEI